MAILLNQCALGTLPGGYSSNLLFFLYRDNTSFGTRDVTNVWNVLPLRMAEMARVNYID